MVDYTKSTGNSGTMIIRDSGGKVSFLLKNSSSQTYAYGKSWSGTINGSSVSGTYDIGPNQTVTLVTRTVSSSQTVTFKIGATGTTGLAGPTTFSHSISRSSKPGAPGRPSASNIGTQSVTLSWSAAASNGSSIKNYYWQVSSNSSFSGSIRSGNTGTSRSVTTPISVPAGYYYARVRATNGVGTGPYSSVGTFVTDPAAPTSLKLSGATTNSIKATWSNANNGSQFTGVQYQIDSVSNFSSPQTRNLGTVTSYTFTGLASNDQFWVRVRTKNSVGVYSAWSSVATGYTLSTSPPTIAVVPSADGLSASVSLSPTGSAKPTKYTIQYRQTGTTSTKSKDTTSLVTTVDGLTPGRSYDWRASAWYGTTQSSWSGWVTAVQPSPDTNPGQYFDGDTSDSASVTYDWTGTAGKSISTASSTPPLGWATFEDGSADSGGTGVVVRAVGGRSGDYAARVTFFSDTTAPGFTAGLAIDLDGGAATLPNTGHQARIHVRLSARTQRMAAVIIWADETAVYEVDRTIGEPVVVAAGSGWVPLTVEGVAPEGAGYAVLRVIDVEGQGWSPWKAGDQLLVDDAITPYGASYFDGDTPDSVSYQYDWEGDPHHSPSERITLSNELPDPLIDPDCDVVPAPPRPPVIVDSCVDTAPSLWNRLVAFVESGNVPEVAVLIPTVKITPEVDVRQIRIRWYQAPLNKPIQDLEVDDYCVEQILTFAPAGSTITIDGVTQRVWADVPDGRTLRADHLLASPLGDAPVWGVLSCGVAYYLTIDIPSDIDPYLVEASYNLTVRYS